MLEFTRTLKPSTVIGCDLDAYQFFYVYTRTGALLNKWQMSLAESVLKEVVELDNEVQSIPAQFGAEHYIKLREIFIDDKNGCYTIRIDYLHSNNAEPAYSESQIKSIFNDGIACDFGQARDVEVTIKSELFSSDYFSPVSNDYYENCNSL